MPLNPINFNQPIVDMGYQNLLKDALMGQNFHLGPQKFRQDVEQTGLQNRQIDLQNALSQAKLPYAGQREAAELQKIQKGNEWADQLNMAKIKKDSRSGLSEAARNAMELREIDAGFLPGSDYRIAINPEQQKTLKRQIQLADTMKTSDSSARNKLLTAANIDKTFNSFNPADLVRYAGVGGGLLKKIQQGKSLIGRESEDFKKYQEAVTSADVLAKQVRQFYGDSISATTRKHLEDLTNPAVWANSPEVALRKFKQFEKILRSETDTYRKSIPNSDVLLGEDNSGVQESGEMITLRNPQTGETVTISREEYEGSNRR